NSIVYDDAVVSLRYVPFAYDDQYVYERGFIFYLKDQIDASNRLILMLVFLFSAVFILMIFIARRRIKRQFLIRPSTDSKKPKE
ncbi:MAG TPA: hypothetical protein P5559_11670, partial [Candidatus Limiplasma sp.]|nr:hypothetical protein [Candidatus Limiplasma sp.]